VPTDEERAQRWAAWLAANPDGELADAVRLMQAERIGWAAALERVRRRRVRRFARRIRLARYQRASARPMVYRLTKGMVA
jgi:hypothetical protein